MSTIIWLKKKSAIFLYIDIFRILLQQGKLDTQSFLKWMILSKLAFIGTELLLNGNNFLKHYNGADVGVVMSNSSSSLDSDIKYAATIIDKSNYFPSPALFVYTLPNIMIGEICIRHKLFGENAFFVSKTFSPEIICNYINSMFDNGKIECCLAGWIDHIDNFYEALLIFVEKENFSNSNFILEFYPKTISKLYQRS